MRLVFALVTILLMGAGSASAADLGAAAGPASRPAVWRFDRQSESLPFARTGRSQAVYAASACWSDCQSYCTWGEAACLETDPQGRCLKVTDRCDRYCQRDCRTRGGPLVSVEMPWD